MIFFFSLNNSIFASDFIRDTLENNIEGIQLNLYLNNIL